MKTIKSCTLCVLYIFNNWITLERADTWSEIFVFVDGRPQWEVEGKIIRDRSQEVRFIFLKHKIILLISVKILVEN